MIRKSNKRDIDEIMDIWLSVNVKAHDFIPADYWIGHFDMVKEMLPKATVYVYEDAGGVQAFIGLDDDYVAGIFVDGQSQSRGIGSQLLDYAKQTRDQLTLHVYEKNERAVSFYKREGFVVGTVQEDVSTGEMELCMKFEATEEEAKMKYTPVK